MKLRNRIRELRYVKSSELLPNPRNWRTHPQEQQDALRGVLAEVGIADALLVRETPAGLQLIDGHCRADVDSDVEWPCLVLDVDEVEAAKLLATVDPLASMAETDGVKLEQLLAEVDAQSSGLQELLNRLSDEAAASMEADPPAEPDPGDLDDPEPEVNRADELQAKWKTERGQLWILEGKQTHRLMCGDSTCREDVEWLMGGERPRLMVTDPPYGVKLDPSWRDRAGLNELGKTDSSHKAYMNSGKDDTEARWDPVWLLSPSDVAYVWCAGSRLSEVVSALADSDIVLRQFLIWDKQMLTRTRSHYWWSHEHCIYAVRRDRTSKWIGAAGQSTILRVPSPKHIMSKSEEDREPHPAQKPLECMATPIRNHEGDVYEPFAGSGTTLIAAEQLNRRCFAMELAPQYVAVILERATKVGITPRLE